MFSQPVFEFDAREGGYNVTTFLFTVSVSYNIIIVAVAIIWCGFFVISHQQLCIQNMLGSNNTLRIRLLSQGTDCLLISLLIRA